MCVDSLSYTCAEYDHPVDDLYLAISLGMESGALSELGVQHRPETGPKCTEEPAVSI